MDKPTTIRMLADEIEHILNKNEVPIPNGNAVSAIRRAAAKFRGVSDYSSEKASELSELTEIYYSARKHDKYQGGADAAYVRMKYDLLDRIRQDADMFENASTDT